MPVQCAVNNGYRDQFNKNTFFFRHGSFILFILYSAFGYKGGFKRLCVLIVSANKPLGHYKLTCLLEL